MNSRSWFRRFREIGLAADGAFAPVDGDTYPLDATADAFRDMQERDAFGKLVVEP